MREKLIELLKSGGVRDFPFNAALADHLIANGVTVQDSKVVEIDHFNKWIPVTERLPEEMEWVLCASVCNTIHILRYDFIMEDWDIYEKLNSCYGKGFVTHWMPLPEPPKEGVTNG